MVGPRGSETGKLAGLVHSTPAVARAVRVICPSGPCESESLPFSLTRQAGAETASPVWWMGQELLLIGSLGFGQHGPFSTGERCKWPSLAKERWRTCQGHTTQLQPNLLVTICWADTPRVDKSGFWCLDDQVSNVGWRLMDRRVIRLHIS